MIHLNSVKIRNQADTLKGQQTWRKTIRRRTMTVKPWKEHTQVEAKCQKKAKVPC